MPKPVAKNRRAAPARVGPAPPKPAHIDDEILSDASDGDYESIDDDDRHDSFDRSPSVDSNVSESDEDEEDYRPGGYHDVRIGENFKGGRYCVVGKLGWGHFSTVWLAQDTACVPAFEACLLVLMLMLLSTRGYVALKVMKSERHYTETAQDEIQLCNRVRTGDPDNIGRQHVCKLLDSFDHRGPNGIRAPLFSFSPFYCAAADCKAAL